MDPRVVVVGTARNGVEAIEQARSLDPDVITLDVIMPELNGLEALVHIRKHTAARVVMLTTDSDSDTMYEALSLGAVDFMAKPTTGVASSLTELTETLLKKIRSAYRMPAIRGVVDRAERDTVHADGERLAPVSVENTGPPRIVVAMAASTGGPPALETVFSSLSRDVPAAYVVVQHLPMGFSASLARRLGTVGTIPGAEATDGRELESGCAYIIPYGHHATVVRDGDSVRLRFIDSPPRHGVRPSADTLFESVASELGDHAVGVVLSGMGTDGALGAVALREAGAEVVVQDEETSTIWGMPGTTVRLGGATTVAPVGRIAAELRGVVRRIGERYDG
jgi:two-component system chemotaxis response regulator CheB